MRNKMGYLLAITAIALATCAAFFSVYGISKLFAGATLAVVIMASTLEFSKLVIATFLHNYWEKMSKILRIYLSTGLVVLVIITSVGIYGFLSNAYQKTANDLSVQDNKISLLESKIEGFNNKLETNNSVLEIKSNRFNRLSNLRAVQENRLDSMISKRYFSNANKTRDEISNANNELIKIRGEIDLINDEKSSINDSISTYETKKIELANNSEIIGEIGPLRYISKITNTSMDNVVNYMILLLIFVFDPLAISLVIATSFVFNQNKEGGNVRVNQPKKKVTPPKEEKPKEETPKKDRKIIYDEPKKKESDVKQIGTNKFLDKDNNVFYRKT